MQINKIELQGNIKNEYITEFNTNNEIEIAVWCDGCNDWVKDVCVSPDQTNIHCIHCKELLLTIISKKD